MAKGGGGGNLFGGIVGGVSTNVHCNADDQSNYCRFARLINMLVWTVMILAILYFLFTFLSKKRR